ncbi:MAG: hypothetical protein ABEI75_00310 [Halobaculum sp.]
MHCPNCETEITGDADVTFTDVDATTGVVRASKRYYTVACASCGESLGSGVAGAKANAAATDGGTV